jgi:protease-4
MGFFKTFFAVLLALVVFFGVCFFLMMGLIGALSAEDVPVIEENSVLHLRLGLPVTELQVDNPLEGLPLPGNDDGTIGLLQLKEAIAKAKEDDKVKGIFLETPILFAGWSSADEVRQSLLDFRSSGKWIVSYAEFYTEGAYYLASAADKVYLNPQGEIEFNGLVAETTFFKRMFDKIEVKPEVFRVGDFKSAVEPFFLEKMSAESRMQVQQMVDGIHDQVLRNISETRKIPRDKLEEMADKYLVRNADLAVTHGLVDATKYHDEVMDDLRGRLGLSGEEEVTLVRYSRYRKSSPSARISKSEIAVIVADGTIMPGKADNGVVGGKTFMEEIRKARTSKKVKAIVLRVNSPGGAFQTSDELWRELRLAAEEKPVIASMSDVAASGGYYLAMACDSIVAQPTTITGSIGIFSVLFDISGMTSNKLGITSDEVRTGEVGDLSPFLMRPLTDVERSLWQRRTEEIYDVFTSKAADGRGMTQEDIRKIASGRVWIGRQAKDNGLVDVLGSFRDAVEMARQAAGLDEDYALRYYPRPKSQWEQLLSWGDDGETEALRALPPELAEGYKRWVKVARSGGIQARIPFEWDIR